MALGTPLLKTSFSSGTDAQSYSTASISVNAGDLLVVFVTGGLTGGGGLSPATIGGTLGSTLTWTKAGQVTMNSSAGAQTSAWVAACPVGASGTLTFDFGSGNVMSNCEAHVSTLTGANLADPLVTANTTTFQFGSANPSFSLNQAPAPTSVVMASFHYNSTATATAGTGWTLSGTQTSQTSPALIMATEYRTGSASTTVSETHTAFNGGAIAIEIRPAAAFSGSGSLSASGSPAIPAVGGATLSGSGGLSASGFAALSGGYSALVLADAPDLYWRLDEASGTAAGDSSGNGRTGTYTGTAGVTQGAAGLLPEGNDSAISLSGSVAAQGVQRASEAWMQSQVLTAEVLFSPATVSSQTTAIFGRANYGGLANVDAWGIHQTNDTVRYYAVNGITSYSSNSAAGSLVPGSKYLATMVLNGTTATHYLNGVQVATRSIGGTGVNNGTRPLTIGYSPTSTGSALFSGTVDEAAIWLSSHTSTQVANRWAAANAGATGTATLGGSGSLSTTGSPSFAATATLSGSGSLSAAGTPAPVATALFSGSGALTTTGTPALATTAALAGSGTLAAAGSPTTSASATLTGAGQLTASGAPSTSSTAALAGSGSLTADGSPATTGTATLTGAGTLTTSGTPAYAATVALSGTGTLSAAGAAVVDATAVLSGAGTLAATGSPAFAATAALTGSGVLTTTGILHEAATAALSGAGALSATGATAATAAAALSGSGSLLATGTAAIAALAFLTGEGTLEVDVSTLEVAGLALLTGLGELTADGVAHIPTEDIHIIRAGLIAAAWAGAFLAGGTIRGALGEPAYAGAVQPADDYTGALIARELEGALT